MRTVPLDPSEEDRGPASGAPRVELRPSGNVYVSSDTSRWAVTFRVCLIGLLASAVVLLSMGLREMRDLRGELRAVGSELKGVHDTIRDVRNRRDSPKREPPR